MNQIHLIRTTDIHRNAPMWIVCDHQHRLNGRPRETEARILKRWSDLHGQPDKLIRYDGPMRPSEAAATIVSIQEGTA